MNVHTVYDTASERGSTEASKQKYRAAATSYIVGANSCGYGEKSAAKYALFRADLRRETR